MVPTWYRFNPRSPRGERHRDALASESNRTVSIHAPRAGSDNSGRADRRPSLAVSIHAPRAGSDWWSLTNVIRTTSFNPRSPRGERRLRCGPDERRHMFQSTLPARGATCGCFQGGQAGEFQSTLPARGATMRHMADIVGDLVSIHAPRAGSDTHVPHGISATVLFQSTLPARGATYSWGWCGKARRVSIHAPRAGSDGFSVIWPPSPGVSIHAPRAGSDSMPVLLAGLGTCFNPRSPRGERQPVSPRVVPSVEFQSTLPARGATRLGRWPVVLLLVSIHAPRAGSDCEIPRPRTSPKWFQSTLPARGATCPGIVLACRQAVSIHAPRAGSDCR